MELPGSGDGPLVAERAAGVQAGVGNGVGIAAQLHIVAYRAEVARLLSAQAAVDLIAVAQPRQTIRRAEAFVRLEGFAQLAHVLVGVCLELIIAVLDNHGQRVVPFVARFFQQRHQGEKRLVEPAAVGVGFIYDDFIVGIVGDQPFAVAVENLAAHGGRVHGVARGARREPFVFRSVKQLPVRQTGDKHRRRQQHRNGADGKRQLAEQAFSHGSHSFGE